MDQLMQAGQSRPGEHENAPELTARRGFGFWSTRPGSLAGFARFALAERSSAANRRPPRWQRVLIPGFRCLFPRNRRRKPHWARPRSSDATRALRAPPGDPESGGANPCEDLYKSIERLSMRHVRHESQALSGHRGVGYAIEAAFSAMSDKRPSVSPLSKPT